MKENNLLSYIHALPDLQTQTTQEKGKEQCLEV